MLSGDTITAISSAAGVAARMILRLSGPRAWSIATSLGVRDIQAGSAAQVEISFSGLTVPAWMYAFASPRSYTGEDLIELHIPGNPVLAKMLLSELVQRGARQAEAGEFTARAYFNGRMDLTEAEGVAATIAASNEAQLQAARQLLSGQLAMRVKPVLDLVAETLALIEVGIDFSDEDVTFLKEEEVRSRIEQSQLLLQSLLSDSARMERLSHEPRVILVGRPNAGKSTLLNALAGHERAIVSAVAGTTRDLLSAQVSLKHGMIELQDAAGLDQVESDDPIAKAMRDRALEAIERADRVILVREMADDKPPVDLARPADLVVRTKCDSESRTHDISTEIHVSVHRKTGLDILADKLDQLVFSGETGQASLALTGRHVDAIHASLQALSRAVDRMDAGTEIVAMELRDATERLGEILGAVSPDDLLGQIFSRFCIGK